jgi:hypothetical protein
VAHPVTLFNTPNLAVGVSLVVLAALSFLGLLAHERKRAKTVRRSRNVLARAEQERLAGATVRELHLDQREGRDIHPPNRLERVLREALHGEVCDVFPEEGSRD